MDLKYGVTQGSVLFGALVVYSLQGFIQASGRWFMSKSNLVLKNRKKPRRRTQLTVTLVAGVVTHNQLCFIQ